MPGSPILARSEAVANGSGLSMVDGGQAVPRHVAIIMDGNGRWAKARRLPRIAGHRKGVEAVRSVVKNAPDLGITTLTLFAFSSENWKRPADEVSDLMGLLRIYLRNELADLQANKVRLKVIGDYRRLDCDLVALIDSAVAQTAGNEGLTFVIALNYGAQDELARAARAIAEDVAAGRLGPADVDEHAITARLDTADFPPLDLVIRTSGEMRLSNFLLWQAAYAELIFTDVLWPDFNAARLAEAVAIFGQRNRRFGAL